jgi:hypothetical protein
MLFKPLRFAPCAVVMLFATSCVNDGLHQNGRMPGKNGTAVQGIYSLGMAFAKWLAKY